MTSDDCKTWGFHRKTEMGLGNHSRVDMGSCERMSNGRVCEAYVRIRSLYHYCTGRASRKQETRESIVAGMYL